MVKRIAPLPEEDTSNQRSIYAKGFPNTTGYTIEDVHSVFDKFGKVLSVRIRKGSDKKVKPSCFVEFSKVEEAQAAAVAKLSFNEAAITVLMKPDYFQNKKEIRKKSLDVKKAKRKADAQPDEEIKQEGKKELPQKRVKKEDKPASEDDIKISRCVVSVKNIGENMNREYIKEAFSEYGTVAFVDYSEKSENNTSGYVRFGDAESAKKAVELATTAKKQIGGKVVEVAVLTEDEEKQYWKKVSIEKAAKGGQRGAKGKRGRRKRF